MVSRNLLSTIQSSSLDSGASNVPESPVLDSYSLSRSIGRTWRDRVQNPATSSQDWQKDNSCLMKSGACERSGSIGKRVRGVENQLARTKLDHHNMQVSDYRYVNKFFGNLWLKLRVRSYVLDEKTNVLIWGLFMLTTTKASGHLRPSYNENLVAHRNTNTNRKLK